MNRLDTLFEKMKDGILSIFFTAGYPQLENTVEILLELQDQGVDMMEIGMPYSDPVADGPVIQESSKQALENGMSIEVLFKQLETVKDKIYIPIVLMGYLNPILQYGYEDFCRKACELGVDGLIIPDLPPELFVEHYKDVTEKFNLRIIHLITPLTTTERIRSIDHISNGFIYMVSAPSVTGGQLQEDKAARDYFQRVSSLDLKNPTLVGFGISTPEQAKWISRYANGVIIGSAFIKVLRRARDLKETIKTFIQPFKK